MADKLIGRTLGDFRIEELLGRGRSGRVYRAVQKSLDRPVALKVFEEGLFTLEDQKERFRREAEYLARLEHPGIVPVYAAGQEGEFWYFAMRLVEGKPLAAHLEDGMPRCDGVRVLADIAGALHYAHERGLVHRDVKPANILVAAGRGLLADFGLARLLDTTTITASGAYIGTPMYFSPEQARQERATTKSDLFSLGIILYEVATGRHPFAVDGRTPSRDEVVAVISAGTYPDPASACPDVPPALAALCRSILAVDPAARPSGREIRLKLQELGSDASVDDRIPGR